MIANGNVSRSIGYVPHGLELERPFDRRRFPRYATMRGLDFEIVSGRNDHDIIVLSPRADVTRWVDAPEQHKSIVDMPDAFLDEGRGLRRSLRGIAKWLCSEVHRPVLNYHRAVERLLERVSVCRDRESTSLRLTTYLDVGRVPPNPLMDLESIDDLWRFVESDARATIMKGT